MNVAPHPHVSRRPTPSAAVASDLCERVAARMRVATSVALAMLAVAVVLGAGGGHGDVLVASGALVLASAAVLAAVSCALAVAPACGGADARLDERVHPVLADPAPRHPDTPGRARPRAPGAVLRVA